MPAIGELVPAASLGGIMVVLVGYLLRQMGADREDYRARITAEREAVAAAEARADTERARADKAQARIDEEITRRRKAEDQASALSGELRALSATFSRELRAAVEPVTPDNQVPQ